MQQRGQRLVAAGAQLFGEGAGRLALLTGHPTQTSRRRVKRTETAVARPVRGRAAAGSVHRLGTIPTGWPTR
ncbi:hypothetical protein GCM10020229_29890 [Kitasatospora albolonga]